MTKSSDYTRSKFNLCGNKPLFYPDDDGYIREFIKELIERRRYVRRESKYHLKHRGVNYFYTTGVITIDGQGRYCETGKDAFLKLLDLRYPKQPRPKIDPFENLTLSEKLRTAPIFEVSLDDVDDLSKEHEQVGEDDLLL